MLINTHVLTYSAGVLAIRTHVCTQVSEEVSCCSMKSLRKGFCSLLRQPQQVVRKEAPAPAIVLSEAEDASFTLEG